MNLIFRSFREFLEGIGYGTIFVDSSSSTQVLLSSMVAIGKRSDVFAIGYLSMDLSGISPIEVKTLLKEYWKTVYDGVIKENVIDKVKISGTKFTDINVLKMEIKEAVETVKKEDIQQIPFGSSKPTKKSITDDLMKDRGKKRQRTGKPDGERPSHKPGRPSPFKGPDGGHPGASGTQGPQKNDP